MKIVFEIIESLDQILDEIVDSEKWYVIVNENSYGRMVMNLSDKLHGSVAVVELFENEVVFVTAWSKYVYRIYSLGDRFFCQYTGAYRGLLEQSLLPTLTVKGCLLDCEVLESSIQGYAQYTLREYAYFNVKLKRMRENLMRNETVHLAPFDHPRVVREELNYFFRSSTRTSDKHPPCTG